MNDICEQDLLLTDVKHSYLHLDFQQLTLFLKTYVSIPSSALNRLDLCLMSLSTHCIGYIMMGSFKD